MTVSSATNRASYSGNGSTTAFAYGFKIFADSDLTVILRAADGTETTQTLTTHYSVSGVGAASGGNVTFGSAPASGVTVVILREQPLTQGLDLVANDPFPSASVEDSLDKLTFMVQQHDEELGRAIKASKTNTISGAEFTVSATNRANKLFAFDSSGNLNIAQELGTFRGDFAASTAYSVRDLIKDTSTNNIFLVNAAHTSSGSQPLTTNSNSAKYTLIVDAASAATSATAAAASESAAETAQAASETARDASVVAKDASVVAKDASVVAKDASVTAKNSAETALASFTGQYSTGSSDPSSNLNTGDLFYNSSTNLMKVYTGSAWVALTPSSSDQTNINALAASAVITDMALLATDTVIADMAILATDATVADLAILATTDVVSDMNTLGTSDVVTDMNVLGTSANVTAMNTLGTSANVTAMSNVSGSIANVNTVGTNISSVNDFADKYRIGSSDPSSNNDEGDLFYNTSTNILKVYTGSAWEASVTAGSDLMPKSGGIFTGDITIPDKIIHSGDTNTAVRFPAVDTFTVETSGSERFRVGSSGQIGFGGENFGTAGQVLQSNGNSAVPTWVAAGSGALVHISTVSASGASSASVSGMNSTYDRYIIKGDNIEFSANGTLFARINGTSSAHKTLRYGLALGLTSMVTNESNSNSLNMMQNICSTGTDADNVISFTVETGSVNNTGHQHIYATTVQSRDTSGDAGVRRMDSAASLTGSSGAMTSIQFFPSSGTFTGKFRLYGVSKAND